MPSATGFSPRTYAEDYPADNPYSISLFNLEVGTAYQRNYFMGGLPSYYQSFDLPAQQPQVYVAAVQAWLNYLTGQGSGAGGWGTVVRSKNITNPPVPNINSTTSPPVYALVSGQGTLLITTTGTPLGATVGQKVRLLGVTGGQGVNARPWNGDFTVEAAPNPTTLTLITKDTPLELPVLNWSQAYAWAITPQAVAYTGWTFSKLTHRKRGNSSAGVRGRSKTR